MTVEAILLGTAQDGGVPHAGCNCTNCEAARTDASRRRLVVCLGLVDYDTGQSWLIDATPDFPEQLHALKTMAPACRLAGIILTHAHIGHYTGLINLGREVMATRGLPVYATQDLSDFLRHNGPWSQLVELGNIELHRIAPNVKIDVSPDVHLIPWLVPHRNEFGDTVAFVVHGPKRALFYCPDIDSWDQWEHDLRTFADSVDVVLLDGTFFSDNELPERNQSMIPHPLVTDTATRLDGVECEVQLIHLNHSNPLHAPGPEMDWLAAQGVGVGIFGQRWQLG